jgi:hypothetical protein
MTVTIVPANPGFFAIHAHPGERAPYEIFSQVSVIAWRIEDESRMLPEPITPEGVCRRNSDCYPRAVLHPNDSVTSLSGRVVERTYPHVSAWLEDCCTPEERATFVAGARLATDCWQVSAARA